jgi:hypothetical protein
MRKIALFAVAAATLGTAFTATSHAAPPPGGPAGAKCAFNSTTDVTREAGWQTGDLRAGPLVTGEDGSLHCTITVNGEVRASAAGVTVAASVAVVVPVTLNYQATAADDIQICTTWVGASGTLYWHGGNPADPTSLGFWDGTPGNCSVPLSIEPNDPECSIWKAIDRRAGTNIAEIWQDCEPYDEFPLPI